MHSRALTLTFFIVLAGAGVVAAADSAGRLYGRITTVDGDTYEGLIRWDKNEVGWVDILDASKERVETPSTRARHTHKNRTRIEVFGIKIGEVNSDGDEFGTGSSQCGIRLGNIKTIEPDGDDAQVTLKSGKRVRLIDGSTDIGSGVREIIIEDNREGETELSWEDLAKLEFMPAKGDVVSSFGDRLYGTVTTRRGEQYTGFVAWDADEAFGSDVLDGESKDRPRKIRFEKIAAIERYSSNGASVTLKTGENLVLRGTNDVDDGNRGIVVCDPAFGQATISWEQFEKLELKPAPGQISYDQFDGGRPLYGKVFTEEGDEYTGTIRWDDDEEYTWEMLDGEFHDVPFEIELGLVKVIEKQSSTTSLVTISDGRTFRLRGSNDVDETNRGIFIKLESGKTVEVDWNDFSKVEFSSK